MRGTLRCGSLGMKITPLATALTIATAAVAAAPAAADSPPVKGGGHTALPVSKGIRPVKLDGAGTVTLRPRITRVAMKVMRRYRKTKIKVGLGVEREDGRMWSDPGDWSRTALVR